MNIRELYPTNDWLDIFEEINTKTLYLKKINKHLISEYNTYQILPKKEAIFNAFKLTNFASVKVVIFGQDPYPNPIYPNGMAFSVNQKVNTLPRSLSNIYKALKYDLNIDSPYHGNLESWAKQGVLLLNTVLTTRAYKTNSHQKKIGWENFTNQLTRYLSSKKMHLIFVLWGKAAEKKINYILNPHKHLILKSSHPSPFSAHKGFLTCKHFSKINDYLEKNNKTKINWIIN